MHAMIVTVMSILLMYSLQLECSERFLSYQNLKMCCAGLPIAVGAILGSTFGSFGMRSGELFGMFISFHAFRASGLDRNDAYVYTCAAFCMVESSVTAALEYNINFKQQIKDIKGYYE